VSLLIVRDLAKSYAGAPALSGAALEVRAGEVHALMGENGAGKSTLIKILAGVVAADGGDIAIDGRPVSLTSPADALAAGLRFIHQELSFVPQLSVAENIMLGRDYPRRFGLWVDWDALNRTAAAVLAQLGITHIPPGRRMARLSIGDQMLVKIAAVFGDTGTGGAPARLYVMDEPTAALSAAESERLFAAIARLKAEGAGIIYVSHRIDEVLRIADRLTVLRDGRTVATRAVTGLDRAEIIELMIGRKLTESYPPPLVAAGSDVTLDVEGLSAGPLRDVTFSLHRGEILGIAGLEGQGQSDLIRALMGAEGAVDGLIRLNGKPVDIDRPTNAWDLGFALVPRERRREGLAVGRSVTDNALLPHVEKLTRFGLVMDSGQEERRSAELGADVRLKSTGGRQKVRELSGGNQQKVVFARAIAGQPSVLLLDEPTRGVDVGARYDIYALLRELTAEGLSVLIASSDFPELLGMADRILVLRHGRLDRIVRSAELGLNPQTLIALCYGPSAAPASPESCNP
jgi:ABC-type sugar transport system ATPase subunit